MPDHVVLKPVGFPQLAGWEDDDPLAAFDAFSRSARRMVQQPYKSRPLGADSDMLRALARRALELGSTDTAGARHFFEKFFTPHEIVLPGNRPGFLTGYFEPEVAASPVPTSRYRFPIYRQPDDLVAVGATKRAPTLDADCRYGRPGPDGIEPYLDRAAIEEGALSGRGLELAWLEDRVDVFFIHVQGAARLRHPDGHLQRITFAAKSGHPYTSVGKLVCDRHAIDPAQMTADKLADWLRSSPQEAEELIRCNRSYIFFREETGSAEADGPIAAAKVPLMQGRSLAVDRSLYTFGTPFWVATDDPLPGSQAPLARLMVAHDTGSAITGAARGDYFAGSGDEAGDIAGRIRHATRFSVLLPKAGATL